LFQTDRLFNPVDERTEACLGSDWRLGFSAATVWLCRQTLNCTRQQTLGVPLKSP